MEKKIGIISLYYNNYNYGGNLQAYALTAFLSKNGYNVEQITYNCRSNTKTDIKKKLKGYTFWGFVTTGFRFIYNKIKRIPQNIINYIINNNVKIRRKSFDRFNHNVIKHSIKEYDKQNIDEYDNCYDVVITGSDQVWNFKWYNKAFFLDFVPSDKKKVAYAASIGMDNLTEKQKEIFRNSLKDFVAVSVREKSDVELIKDCSPVPVVNTLDPTLLLDREDWDKICADRVVEEKYIFCYFLGDNKKERKLAIQFAKRNGLKIVTLPHLDMYKKADRFFGDYRFWDLGPEQFLSLIKYAKYVFTDSFHAVVFSNIYQRQYFVFNRSSKGEMNSRIYNVTELFENPERFCDTKEKESLQYIETLEPINYNRDFEKYDILKEQSIKFLLDNLGEPIK